MNVPQDDLNTMAETALTVNGTLLRVASGLRRFSMPLDVQDELEAARSKNYALMHKLVRAGADDPLEAAQQRTAAVLTLPSQQPLTLEMLTSPAAVRYARAMREAATACRGMETERYGAGCDGFAESLEDWAEGAELEAFGPTGLQERE